MDNFTLMGHSMGARTAMQLAIQCPERVDAVIAVESAPVDERNTQTMA